MYTLDIRSVSKHHRSHLTDLIGPAASLWSSPTCPLSPDREAPPAGASPVLQQR